MALLRELQRSKQEVQRQNVKASYKDKLRKRGQPHCLRSSYFFTVCNAAVRALGSQHVCWKCALRRNLERSTEKNGCTEALQSIRYSEMGRVARRQIQQICGAETGVGCGFGSDDGIRKRREVLPVVFQYGECRTGEDSDDGDNEENLDLGVGR